MKKIILLIIAICLGWSNANPALAVTDSSLDDYSDICVKNYVCTCTFSDSAVRVKVDNVYDASACRTGCTNVTSAATESEDTTSSQPVGYEFQCDNSSNITLPTVSGSLAPIAPTTAVPAKEPVIPCLNVPIPGLSFGNCTPDYDGIGANPDSAKNLVQVENGVVSSNLLGLYVEAVYQYLLIAAAIVAVTMLMIAGLQYATARGESKQVEQAKKRINNAVVGIILLLLAYNIAFLINPATTTFSALTFDAAPPAANPKRAEYMAASNSGGTSTIAQYKSAPNPTQDELKAGVKFFATSYYKPTYGEKGFGGISFECNIAMQCACPKGGGRRSPPPEAKTCYSPGLNYYWEPCNSFAGDVPYCNKTKTKTEPQAYHTAAVSSALPKGTVFKIFGAPDSASNSAVWYAEDEGGEIKGRRIDLFLGTGAGIYDKAIHNSGEVILRICPDNDPAKCPTSPD